MCVSILPTPNWNKATNKSCQKSYSKVLRIVILRMTYLGNNISSIITDILDSVSVKLITFVPLSHICWIFLYHLLSILNRNVFSSNLKVGLAFDKLRVSNSLVTIVWLWRLKIYNISCLYHVVWLKKIWLNFVDIKLYDSRLLLIYLSNTLLFTSSYLWHIFC